MAKSASRPTPSGTAKPITEKQVAAVTTNVNRKAPPPAPKKKK